MTISRNLFAGAALAALAMASAAAAAPAQQGTPTDPQQAQSTAPAQPVTTAPGDTPAAPASSAGHDDDASAGGDIIVTAQRRAENAQKTSLAVTALSGADLTERGVRDLQDLQNVSPSFSFADAGLLKFANIRGIGLNLQSPTVVSGVATYRDGLFSPSPLFFNEGLFDIASVEVLRGPQGTFVGQNSTGGAIIQKSVSPTLDRLSGDVQLSGGNYGFIKSEAAINVPLTDTLAVRVAGMTENRDSFYHNIGPEGDKPGRVIERHARVGLLWQPSSNFSALLKAEVNFGDDGGYPGKPIPTTYYAQFAPADPFTLNYDRTDTRRKEFSLRTGLEMNYTTDGGVVFRSISGYQYGYQDFIDDLDGSSSPDLFHHQQIHDNVYSEEVNIISPDRGPFKWVVGGTYVYQTAQLFLHIYDQQFPFGTIFPIQDIFINTLNPKHSLGFFAQGTYKLTDRLSIDLGGRYSRDTQSQEGGLTLSPTPPLPGYLDGSSPHYQDSFFTGKAAINFQATPDHLFYVFVANGFKPGGVNLPTGTFKPERVLDVEGGWKGTLGHGLIRTQVDGFYMDYRDLQLNIFNTYTDGTAVSNAGKSTIYGAEAQVELHAGGFSSSTNVSYVHSRLGQLSLIDTRALPGGSGNGLGIQCPAGVASNPPVCFDYTPYIVSLDGRHNLYSPKWTVSSEVQYRFDLANGATLTPQASISYLSNQTTTPFEVPALDFLGPRHLVGVELTYGWKRYTVTGYATNLLNETYRIGNDNANNLVFYGAPRQYGIRIGARF